MVDYAGFAIGFSASENVTFYFQGGKSNCSLH
jgi:hypothetical protein